MNTTHGNSQYCEGLSDQREDLDWDSENTIDINQLVNVALSHFHEHNTRSRAQQTSLTFGHLFLDAKNNGFADLLHVDRVYLLQAADVVFKLFLLGA